MIQNKIMVLALAASLTQLGGCLSGDENDPEDVGLLPIEFSESNAETELKNAISNMDISRLDNFSGAEVSQLNPGMAFFSLEQALADMQSTVELNNVDEVVSGVATGLGGDCPGGGSWTKSGDTATITDCVYEPFTMNGVINYVTTQDGTISTKQITGDISFKKGITFKLKDLNFSHSDDTSTGLYTIDPFSFSLDVLVNGYQFSTPTPIVGVSGQCPTSGSHRLLGKGGTMARATYSEGTVIIAVDNASGAGFVDVATVVCEGWYKTDPV